MENHQPEGSLRCGMHWLRLVMLIAGFVVLSAVLTLGLQVAVQKYPLPLRDFRLAAYLVVFAVSMVVNASLLPVPFAVPIMILAARIWDPITIALVASIGGSLGEFTGYYVGYLTRKLALHGEVTGYRAVRGWVRRYGLWAIAFLSFQPVIPVELGGLVAGAARMPVSRFMFALWIGKFPKYLLIIYAGLGFIRFFPSFFN